ncbi:hypothetical protein WD019_15070 [Fictibacillus sp. Mic-4]|uniref:hypothetical protein n=1 Tax=Fictibacillus sp. Mic-4 TaxID=3132826 RepID=UPI003CF90752
MALKKVSLVLNVDDPEQQRLYQFVTQLPNGKKRNASAFLKMLVDREYQKQAQLITPAEPKVIKGNGGIKFTLE